MNPTKLANRLLTFNAVFLIGMVYVFGHTVLDLYGSLEREEYLDELEAECRQVSAKYNGLSSREAVGKLHRIDSVNLESMRVSECR